MAKSEKNRQVWQSRKQAQQKWHVNTKDFVLTSGWPYEKKYMEVEKIYINVDSFPGLESK